MSTLKETVIVLLSYYIIVFGGRELMKNRPAFKFNPLFMFHNLYLTIISGGLLVLFVEQLLSTVVRKGIFFAICDHDGGWTNRLVTLYYVCRELKIEYYTARSPPLAELHYEIHRTTRYGLPCS